MTTFADLDPTSLPSYPTKPHKTGQARVVIDNRSQYLGRFGTVESHALYHLLCLNKLLTGSAPTTRDVREQLSRLANETPPARPLHNRPSFQLAALLATACLSMLLGAGAVTTWNRDPEVVQLNKPVLAGDTVRSDQREVIADSAQVSDADVFDRITTSVRDLESRHKELRLSEIVKLATRTIQEAEAAGKETTNGPDKASREGHSEGF